MASIDDLAFVLADRVQLQQVLLNLIINGVEAMSSVADGWRELLVYSRLHESNQVLVGVQDFGVGIEPENLKKIFDPFYAISRSIVENHGGKVCGDHYGRSPRGCRPLSR